LTNKQLIGKYHTMLIVQVTGSQIRDARVLAGLSPQQLADRAGVSRLTIRTYELSSAAIPAARVDKLARVIATLESEGVRFVPDGVALDRTAHRPVSVTAPAEAAI
jgi:transcriptional regulator with XRE-family HTH domain